MRLTLVLCAALLLAGCVFTESVFTVNKDNSVDFSFITKVTKEYYADDHIATVKEDSVRFAQYGLVTTAYEDEQTKGSRSEKHFARISDLNEFPLLADTTKAPLPSVVREEKTTGHSLFTISYKPDVFKVWRAGDNAPQDEMDGMLANAVENKVTWKVPFEVVSTNAKVRNDTLGVYSWEFEGAEGDSIYLQYKVPSPAATAAKKLGSLLWVLPLLAGLGVALYFLLRKKKPQPQAVDQAPPEADWPPEQKSLQSSWPPEESPLPPDDGQEKQS